MRALLRCARLPASTAVAAIVLVTALLVGVQESRGDIGIENVDRTSGAPGDRVDVLVYCGGCAPQTVRLPISLLPAGESPGLHPCRGTSCATRAPAPPTSDPYVPVGVAVPLDGGGRLARRLGLEIPDPVSRRGPGAVRRWLWSINRLRFRIPDAEPGVYTYVIFCCGTAPNEGDLIGHPNRNIHRNQARLAHARKDGQFLRLKPDASRAEAPSGIPWALWPVIAALALIALVAVLRRDVQPSG